MLNQILQNNNDNEWNDDLKYEAEITPVIVRLFEQAGFSVTIPSKSINLRGIDVILDGKINIDLKCRRISFNVYKDLLVELVRSTKTKRPGWARDKTHLTDIVMYVFTDKILMYRYSDIFRLAEEKYSFYQDNRFYLLKARTQDSGQYGESLRNGVDNYRTLFYNAKSEQIGKELKIKDLFNK